MSIQHAKGIKNLQSYYAQYADNISVYGMNTITNKIKHKLGKEFYIQAQTVEKGAMFNKFMEKIIPHYSSKYSDKNTKEIMPFIEIVMIDKTTFAYVASGRYIPGKLESAILDDRINNNGVMYIYIFGKNYSKYARILEGCISKDMITNSINSIYVVNDVSDSYDIVSMGYDSRPLDTLVYSFGEIKTITKHINNFMKNVEFYKSKSIPYKTGVLLYGKPGTGKSSLVKALATTYHRNICQVNVANIDKIDFNVLTIMINQDPDKYVVLFEDIDTLFLNRNEKSVDKDYNSIINKLLQFLDSNTSPTDVIFIATTNHIERLDDALLREGRFDLKVEINGLKKESVKEFMDLLECKYTEEYVIDKYGDVGEVGLYNQSRLQNIIVRGREDENYREDIDTTA